MYGLEEHLDHIAGEYSSEFEAAHELSRLTQPHPNDRTKINKLIAADRFVVTQHYPVFCRYTDGLIGSGLVAASDHETREEAVLAFQVLNVEVGKLKRFERRTYDGAVLDERETKSKLPNPSAEVG